MKPSFYVLLILAFFVVGIYFLTEDVTDSLRDRPPAQEDVIQGAEQPEAGAPDEPEAIPSIQEEPDSSEGVESQAGFYEEKEPSLDGTGRFYMGREIAQVMGHLAAGWLERPEREQEEKPSLLMDNLELAPDAVVADIGAGSGYFSFRLAEKVPDGKVLAVDVQPEMITLLEEGKVDRQVMNVETILGRIDDPLLPKGELDAVLMVDAYHEFSHPREMLDHLFVALKSGGQVFLLEYRAEDRLVPIKELHKMSQEQAKREFATSGFEWVETRDFLPWQHFMVFRRP